MNNPWKVVTIGLGVAVVTALTSGLTTAYFLHAGNPAASGDADRHPATLAGIHASPPAESPRPPIVHVTRTSSSARPITVVRDEVAPSVGAASPSKPTADPAPVPTVATTPEAVIPTPAVSAPRPVAASTLAVATTPAVASTQPADCATGGDRAMRIAKPGAIGGLLGAGLGAVGGAIADGGKGAGKGALWGGLAGAATGSAYGAYKTKQECGTIFGGQESGANTASPSRVTVGAPTESASRPLEAPFAPRSVSADDRMTIYNAR